MKPTKKKKRYFAGNMTFSDINKAGYLTKLFMKYIRSAEQYNMKATKRGFYKIIKKDYSPGHNSTFFSAIRQSGIVELQSEWMGAYKKCWYVKGPNWYEYVNGTFNN